MIESSTWKRLLDQKPPRSVPGEVLSAALFDQRRKRACLAVVTVICALFFAVTFPTRFIDDLRLDLSSRATAGVVLQSQHAGRTIGDDIFMRKRHVFRIRFEFTDLSGNAWQTNCFAYSHLKPGEPVAVEYSPTDATIACIKQGFFVPGGWLDVVWTLTFPLIAVFGFWDLFQWRRRRANLLANGILTQGRIERVSREHPQDKAIGHIRLTFDVNGQSLGFVRAASGKEFEWARQREAADPLITVIYNSALPADYVIIDLLQRP